MQSLILEPEGALEKRTGVSWKQGRPLPSERPQHLFCSLTHWLKTSKSALLHQDIHKAFMISEYVFSEAVARKQLTLIF